MIIDNLDYHEPFEEKFGISGGFLDFIPTQTFQKQEFLNGQLVANSEVTYGASANGIRSAVTTLLNFSQMAQPVARGFLSSASSSIASQSE